MGIWTMKRLSMTPLSLAALSMTAPAMAADMAVKAAPPAPVVAIYNWSGFYIGANGGWGQSHGCVDFLTPAGTVAGGCADRSGGLVGGQIGYRWQTNQSVLGLEAQGDWAEIKNTRVSLIDPLISTTGKIDGIGLFTAQFGWAWKASLFYVKGGAAVTRNRFDVFNNLTGVGLTPQVTRAGAVPSVSAGNTVSRRIGRSASNTTISGWGVTTRPSQAWSRPGESPFSATGSARMWTWSHFG